MPPPISGACRNQQNSGGKVNLEANKSRQRDFPPRSLSLSFRTPLGGVFGGRVPFDYRSCVPHTMPFTVSIMPFAVGACCLANKHFVRIAQ